MLFICKLGVKLVIFNMLRLQEKKSLIEFEGLKIVCKKNTKYKLGLHNIQ